MVTTNGDASAVRVSFLEVVGADYFCMGDIYVAVIGDVIEADGENVPMPMMR